MEIKKMLEGPLSEGLAWAQQAACDALPAGAVYEVRHYIDNQIAWKQVDADLPILGACLPKKVTVSYVLLGRFIAS